MQIAVLNYSLVTPTVDLYTIPDDIEDVEEYMTSTMDYNMNNCSWMCGDYINICDSRTDK